MPGTGNPYSPEDADPERDHSLPANTRPPLERLQRLGATPEDLRVAMETWIEMTETERHQASAHLESLSDDELTDIIAEGRGSPGGTDAEAVPEGTVEEILAWVGDDPARASAAIDHEYLRPRPRASLLAALTRV